MTNEQREAIELAKEFTKMDFSNPMGWTGYYDAELEELSQAIDTVLSLIKEQQEKIAKYEKIIDKISQDPFNELRVDGIRFCGEDIKQYFERKVRDEK